MNKYIIDPLNLARVIAALEQEIIQQGLSLSLSNDLIALTAARNQARGSVTSPMFDPEIASLDEETVFWIKLENAAGDIVGLSAYRMDMVSTNLADWAPGWMIGHYMRRNELIVPSHLAPPSHSLTRQLKGCAIYYGELWHHADYRRQNLLDIFPRIGLFLSFLKWHPNFIWGLAATPLARRGGVVKIGFPRLERSFLRWDVAPQGADINEWVSLAQPQDLEFMVAEEYQRRFETATD